MIQFSNVTKRFKGGFEALTNVSMHLGVGEMAWADLSASKITEAASAP